MTEEKTMPEVAEAIIVKYTRLIHPVDLGVETIQLESHLRSMAIDIVDEIQKQFYKSRLPSEKYVLQQTRK